MEVTILVQVLKDFDIFSLFTKVKYMCIYMHGLLTRVPYKYYTNTN
jgi:hypothetical protein